MTRNAADVMDATLGVTKGSTLDLLRAQRPEVRARTQSVYLALFDPVFPSGLSASERFAIALRVAELNRASALTIHYRDRLAREVGAWGVTTGISARLSAILWHTERVSLEPSAASRGDLESLTVQGLTEAEIVTLSQIMSFVAYQIRVAASLAVIVETL
jgi:uncharacterized protein YciW